MTPLDYTLWTVVYSVRLAFSQKQVMRACLHRRFQCLAIVGLSLGVVAAPAETQNQARNGRLQGSVRDASDEPVTGATVTLAHPSVKRPMTTTTGDNGGFAMIGLQGGTWVITIEAPGFYPAQAQLRLRGSGRRAARVSLVMNRDPLRPTTPSTGLLAGVNGEETQLELDAADGLYEAGQYDQAIQAYDAILVKIPSLTTVNLQVGHAYREKKECDKARAAYQEVLKGDPGNEEAKAALNMVNREE